MTNIDWTQVLVAFITLLTTLVTTLLVPPARAHLVKRGWVEEAQILVTAVEKIMPDALGADKKSYVHRRLREKGIKYDPKAVNELIESAVFDVKGQLFENETEPIKDVHSEPAYADPKDVP